MSNVTKLDFEESVKYLQQIQEVLDTDKGLGSKVLRMKNAATEAFEKCDKGQVWLDQIAKMSTEIGERIRVTCGAIDDTIKALKAYEESLADFSNSGLKGLDDM